MTNKTIYRKDYQAPVFAIESVALEFDLYDDHALVTNRMHVKRLQPGPLYLHGDELELLEICVNDQKLTSADYDFEDQSLIIHNCPDTATLNIITRIKPQENTKLAGLYRSNNLFCTQCEAQGFRRITYFPDRPDVLTEFTTRISADKTKYPVLLSNGNLLDSGDYDNGRHWVTWHDPFKKPSYLFALVAGRLNAITDQFTTTSGKNIELKIYVEPGNEHKCQHAMDSLKRAMRWDEEQFGREYDLDIFMIVAVSDFNMGAMENKGLNIFNAKYILASPETATDQDYADIEGVVGHEYFHNWTGNRVTCRDWFQLSLKEGLTVFRDQEFSRDMNARDVFRIMDVSTLRNAQFPEDAGAMAHPVRPESYQEINNFYTATIYNKGAEVIRMQQTLLRPSGFRRGMDLYFQRHDGQAVTIDDFVAAMEDANKTDLTQFKLWYIQAGTPEVTVQHTFQDNKLTLSFTQTCRSTPECTQKQPFHIPIRIALFDTKGNALPLKNDILELREHQQQFEFDGLEQQPYISLLRDFSAPISLQQNFGAENDMALMRFETDGFAKWNAAQNLALNCIINLYANADYQIPQTLLNSYKHVLTDESLDLALRALLLTPPSFEDATAELQAIDVEKLERARDAFKAQLGLSLWPELTKLYEALWEQEDHLMTSAAYKRRQYRNTCLRLMMKAQEAQALKHCQTQFYQAKIMTDQLAAFALIINCQDNSLRQQVVTDFYNQWSKDELVLDKWFAIQAISEHYDTLTIVEKLLTHPAFHIKNPNKVRALIGSFCMNHRNFHAVDGSGYRFLTKILLQMDSLNPQVSARLATPFTRGQRLDKKRQELIHQELQALSAKKLSVDLRELVDKSLST